MSWGMMIGDGDRDITLDTTCTGEVSVVVSDEWFEFRTWLSPVDVRRLAAMLIEAASEEEKLTNKETKE